MSLQYKISAPVFNAVLSAQGVDDARTYLNGFFLCANRLEIVATNGHMICKAPVEASYEDGSRVVANKEKGPYEQPSGRHVGWIMQGVTKPLRKSVEVVYIDPLAKPENRLILTGARYTGPQFMRLDIVRKDYPDYQRVCKDPDPRAEVTAQFSYNAEYLYRPLKWAHFGTESCPTRVTVPQHPDDAAKVEFSYLHPLEMYLMGVRF